MKNFLKNSRKNYISFKNSAFLYHYNGDRVNFVLTTDSYEGIPKIGETNVENKVVENSVKTGVAGLTLSEVVKWFKNVDLDGIQEGIGNVQRVLGVVQDFSKKDSSSQSIQSTYKPRPLYKHFED